VQMFSMVVVNGSPLEAVRLSDKTSQLTAIGVSMFLRYASAVSSQQLQSADFILSSVSGLR
jgi:hypothetical protein